MLNLGSPASRHPHGSAAESAVNGAGSAGAEPQERSDEASTRPLTARAGVLTVVQGGATAKPRVTGRDTARPATPAPARRREWKYYDEYKAGEHARTGSYQKL